MATSGSTNFNQTRNEIIQDALALIGVYGVGRTISDEDMNAASNQLNRMVKHWQAKGLHLWAKEEAVLFMSDNTGEYTFTTDRAALASDAQVVELSSAVAASGTSLTVNSTTGMAASDNIGIVLDDDTIHWTTISTVDSSTTLTIASGLASASAALNNVYVYTTLLGKPLRITSIRRAKGVDKGATNTLSEIPMLPLSHEEFHDLSSKAQNGIPTHFYYNPDLTNGQLKVWPRPNDPNYYLKLTIERELEDFDAAGNNPDFPAEWLDTIVWQLAVRLAPQFGKAHMLQTLVPIASNMLEDILNWDAEVNSIQIMPDSDY